MKEIQLNRKFKSKNFMKYRVLVDDEDYDKLNKHNWMVQSREKGSLLYAGRMVGKDMLLMHRVILSVGKRYCVDHIDGNGLNCQKANMRIVTIAQNNLNRIGNKDSSSIFKGVSFDKNWDRWTACIDYKNKRYNLGGFASESNAAKAYNEAAKKYHGEFARLNII